MSKIIRIPLAVVFAATIAIAFIIGGNSDGATNNDARVRSLSEQLRCPVCEGLSVAASPSSTAHAIVLDIRHRVETGQSDSEIRGAYITQYGSWILLTPPAHGLGAALWFVPVGGVLVALGLAAFVLWRRSGSAGEPPTNEAKTLVAAARRSDQSVAAS